MSIEDARPRTWVRVKEGKDVVKHSIAITSFAKIAENLQSIFDAIGRSKYGASYKKEDCRLFMDTVEKGSVVVPCYPQVYTPRISDNEIDPYLTVTGTFDRLLLCYNTNSEGFKNQLEAEIEDPAERLIFLKSLQRITNTNNSIEIATSIQQPKSGMSLPSANDTHIPDLISYYKGNGLQTVSGVIVGYRGEQTNHFFNLRAKNGRSIKCYFPLEDEELINSLYKHWVTVTGDVKITKKSYVIENVTEVKEQKNITLKTIGNYELKKPITFEATYDNENKLWGMVNEDLAIYGYGDTYQKTITSLEDEIECYVVGYSDFPEGKHSADSIKLKRKLEQYLDIAKLDKQIKSRYGDK